MDEKVAKSAVGSQENDELTTLKSAKKARWNEIGEHLNHWFYKPDLDALAIALSVYSAHVLLQNDPVWLFVVGPSGSGKTSIICNALSCLPSTLELSEVNPTSFISGRAKKDGGSSLLFQLPKIGKKDNETQGLLIFKDFTSILARKQETRQEIIAVMREIYDGKYAPRKGTKTMDWKGKISVVAAVTNAIERAWAVQRDLGERFVQVRWPREDGVETAYKAGDQVDNLSIIHTFQTLIKNLVDPFTLPTTKVSPPLSSSFVYLAELAAQLRGTVIRAPNGHTIIDVPPYEAPTRLVKAMIQVAMGHARLFRREEPNKRDIELGRRIGFDSIPLNKLKIVNSIVGETTQSDIVKVTGLQYSTVDWACDELIALDVLKMTTKGATSTYSPTDTFAKLRAKAFGEDWNVVSMEEFKDKKEGAEG